MSLLSQQHVRLGVLVVAALFATACAASRETALTKTDDELLKGSATGDFDAALMEAQDHWSKRSERGSVEKAIAAWERAATIDISDRSEDDRRKALFDVYVNLTHAYYFLSDAHVRFESGDEDARDEKMKEVFNKGVAAAEKGLAVYSPEFAKAIRYEKPWPEAIQTLDKNAAPALYWYSTNMGKWALLEGFATILAHKDNIKAIMDKVEADAPTYFYGAPYRYFGVYYTKLPFPGGDLEKSQGYFDKAIAASPNYLATRVLMAENWATKAEKPDVFKEQLEYVLNFDLSKAPDIEAENAVEQKKAKALMEQMDELF